MSSRGYIFTPKPDGPYMRKALTTDLMLECAQREALRCMGSDLHGWKCCRIVNAPGKAFLLSAQKFADVFSMATAEREAHRALYHKAFPEADVFKFPTPTDGSCCYIGRDEADAYSNDKLSKLPPRMEH